MPKEKEKKEVPAELAPAGAWSKGELGEGARVKFLLPGNKALELVGTVVAMRGDLLDIECDADGKLIEVAGHIETVHASEVRAASDDDTHRHVGNRP